jgi:superfamily II DNA or RNA helicase
MEGKFAIALNNHRILGYVFSPVLLSRVKDKDYYIVTDRISLTNIKQYENSIDKDFTDIVRIVNEYSDNQLLKVFSKKKVSVQEFFNTVTPEFYAKQLRPYIEKRIIRCIDILTGSNIPIYYKKQLNNVYESDILYLHEENARVVFNFSKTEEGLKYFLTINYQDKEIKLTGKDAFILNNNPCVVVLENHIYRFDDIDGKKLIPFFKDPYILIKKEAEHKYFESFVRNAIKHYEVRAGGFNITDLTLTPEPILSIEQTLKGTPALMLNFKYDEKTIYQANKKTDHKVVFTETNGQVTFNRIVRNSSFENHIISSLLKLGLVNNFDCYFLPLNMEPEPTVNSIFYLVNWLNDNHQELQKHGIVITQGTSPLDFYLNSIDLNIEINDNHRDWFDVMAKVKFDKFEIPFVKFRQNIIEGKREYTLPDGRIVVLPEEWFARFKDIFAFSSAAGESIRLNRQHYPLIESSMKEYSGKLLKAYRSFDTNQYKLPEGIEAHLREYQIKGYQWLMHLYNHSFGGCLSDDMGLGKTLQTLTLLKQVVNNEQERNYGPVKSTFEKQLTIFHSIPEMVGNIKPSLIIVPTSLIHNWLNEINRFVPSIKVVIYSGQGRKNFRYYYENSHLIITSYGIIRNDIEELNQFRFLYIILDESQIIKNPHSKTYKAVTQLNARHRLVLTGTPIENSLTDLWAQMNFLNPGLLGTFDFFRNEFVMPIEKYDDKHQMQTLQTIIRPFVLRRTKNEVAPELPERMEQIIYCEMPESQQRFYETEKSKIRNLIFTNIRAQGIEKSSIIILQSLTRLRQIANHPVLIDSGLDVPSGKFEVVLDNIDNILAEKHKALIFSSFVKHLKLFTDYCDKKEIAYRILTGETRKRQDIINEFQHDESTRLFFISIKAGGFGLNLTAADYVLLLDPWWNPAVEDQAVSRAHRIGQHKNVFIYRFITRNTIEEKIIKLQEKKSKLADIFEGAGSVFKEISEDQIMELFN